MKKLSQAYNYHTLPKSVDDYESRKENQAFAHVEAMRQARERQKSLAKQYETNVMGMLVTSKPRDSFFEHENWSNC